MHAPRLLRPVFAALALSLLAACQPVSTGPVLPPDPNARTSVYGKEPKPAPIPQKDIPEGKSSLSPN